MTDADLGAGSDAAQNTTQNAQIIAQNTQIDSQATETAQGGKEAGAEAKAADTTKAAADASQTAVEPKWRDDWRESLANGDDKLLARLKRFQSPDNVIKSWQEVERKLSSGSLKATLPDNATEADVAAYRKSWGVPDTPEGYGIKLPEDMQFDDNQKKVLEEDIAAFAKGMHDEHASPRFVQKAVDLYFSRVKQVEQQLYDAAQDLTINRRAEIKAEYGRDYDKNTKLGDHGMVARIGADAAKELTGLTLADGTKLGDHPLFVRDKVASALFGAGDDVLAASDSGFGGGKSVDDQINDIRTLQFGDDDQRREFHKPETQARYMKLYDIKQRLQNKAA